MKLKSKLRRIAMKCPRGDEVDIQAASHLQEELELRQRKL